MTTLREATMNDLLKFNNVNLDVLTETYNMSFYYHYMSKWPESFTVAEGPNNNSIMGYVLGKAEGDEKLWHGHVECCFYFNGGSFISTFGVSENTNG
jgi:N-terminal acetyltransferase B complex catalytic subunit